jgi:hypothetical protein
MFYAWEAISDKRFKAHRPHNCFLQINNKAGKQAQPAAGIDECPIKMDQMRI